MIETGYLRTLAVSVALLFGLILAFVCVIAPYGVSPLRVSQAGINAFKPKRLAIDRLIKPYEAWRDQPRTTFLCTSQQRALGSIAFTFASNYELLETFDQHSSRGRFADAMSKLCAGLCGFRSCCL